MSLQAGNINGKRAFAACLVFSFLSLQSLMISWPVIRRGSSNNHHRPIPSRSITIEQSQAKKSSPETWIVAYFGPLEVISAERNLKNNPSFFVSAALPVYLLPAHRAIGSSRALQNGNTSMSPTYQSSVFYIASNDESSKKPSSAPSTSLVSATETFPPTQPSTGTSSNPKSSTPTPNPSDDITYAPTLKSTSRPTSSAPTTSPPSGQPSSLPTTTNPTDNPTPEPTKFPSVKPTSTPSKIPSSAPTTRPPTIQPTNIPTKKPTTMPTSTPSSAPSKRPSSYPTNAPSSKPTNSPSSSPTTANPTPNPTNVPSSTPTTKPSSHPTYGPSSKPTIAPSQKPTLKPTMRPSQQPTSLPPTKSPTPEPTKFPTTEPTSSAPTTRPPTIQPTNIPTKKPTTMPTSTPSSAPSKRPSSYPTNAPSSKPTSIPSSNPTTANPTPNPTNVPSSKPTTKPSSHPTNAPSSKPTIAPSQKPTLKPTMHPSQHPTVLPPTDSPTPEPEKFPTAEPTSSPLRSPSFVPTRLYTTKEPSNQPTLLSTLFYPTAELTYPPSLVSVETTGEPSFVTTDPASNISLEPTNHPSIQTNSFHPTALYASMSASLNFKIPMDVAMGQGELTAFEQSVEDFLQTNLNDMDFIDIIDYNATVLFQKVENDTELIRGRFLEVSNSSSLIINCFVTAMGTPAHLVPDFPFQRLTHETLTTKSDVFFDLLFSASSFGDFQSSDPQEESIDESNGLQSGGNKARSTAVAAGSFAGAFALISLTAALFVIRRRQVLARAGGEEDDEESPPTAYAFGELEDVSSLDESEKNQMYPQNIPHLPCNDCQPLSVPVGTAGNNTDVADQWSLDESFPLQRSNQDVKEGRVNSAYISDSDESSANSTMIGQMKTDVFVSADEATVHQPERADKTHCEGYCKLDHEATNEEYGEETDKIESGLGRLYEKAMMEYDDDFDQHKDKKVEDIEEVQTRTRVQPGIKMFSCFADNTFQERTNQDLSAPKLFRSFRSRVERSGPRTNSKEYEVKAPPGPLGIVIDASDRGLVVHSVKDNSPLKSLVQVGDIIMSLDDADCSIMDAADLASWISKKPWKEEQLIRLMSVHTDYDETSV